MIPFEDNIQQAINSGELDAYLNSLLQDEPCTVPYFFQTPPPNRITDERDN